MSREQQRSKKELIVRRIIIYCICLSVWAGMQVAWGQAKGTNPVMNMRVLLYSCQVEEAIGHLSLAVQVNTIDGSTRRIRQLQNSLILTSAFKPFVRTVTIDWSDFSAEVYHLQSQYESSSGVIEFIANRYDIEEPLYRELGGPTATAWHNVVYISISYNLPPNPVPVLNWFEETPYYSVRAINETTFQSETIHNDELMINNCNTCDEPYLPVEIQSFSGKFHNEAVELRWTTTGEQDHLGFYLQRSLSPAGPFTNLPNVFLQSDPTSSGGQHYRFLDYEPPAGRRIYYRLADLSRDGALTVHPYIAVPIPEIGVSRLSGSYPNPFNQATHLSFQLVQESPVQLVVYDVMGRPVRTLLSGVYPAGFHQTVWDGCEETGQNAASGVYFACLFCDGQSSTISVRLVR
jgi:hypothetical protein